MTAVFLAALAMLGLAAVLVLTRIFRGPSNLDRIVATDVLLVIVIAGVALDAAGTRSATSLPLLMILALVSFVGGVAVTRLLGHDTDDTEQADQTSQTGAGDTTDATDATDGTVRTPDRRLP